MASVKIENDSVWMESWIEDHGDMRAGLALVSMHGVCSIQSCALSVNIINSFIVVKQQLVAVRNPVALHGCPNNPHGVVSEKQR